MTARQSRAGLLLLSAALVLLLLVLLQPATVQAFLVALPSQRAGSHQAIIIISKDTQRRPPQLARRRRLPAVYTSASSSSSSSSSSSDDAPDAGQERAITLHALELPLLDDPSEYRSVLQARFPGATLLRWHLSEVMERDGGEKVALAEVVIVERRAPEA